ncbi:MAG: DUF3524 domain-containing protein [Anaerolineales bacterium]|nr:DUF3524 domain-containing protein [Anaerolineales bacterium]MCB9127920.1 DUF3524 domain-containing protein [Ardenticatenales bacterium]MCB9171682.1 DUF3524 domain-containing protein [Ardenticatenales bacterium]
MKIYLLEPYYSGSHKAWADGYAAHSRHEVALLTMAGYFWKWRMHGGALTMAEQLRARMGDGESPALLLISDMLDSSTLLALTRDLTAALPVVSYFHENQLTYPPVPGSKRDLHYGWINYATMMVSDRVLFNSEHHRDEWFDELPRLLKHFPDYVPLDTVGQLRARSRVLSPGVGLVTESLPPRRERRGAPPLILWNHRWEFDKAPQQFFTLLDRMVAQGLPFRLALAGESFRNQPDEFLAARERFKAQLVHFGFARRDQYRALLAETDIVVSTAIHEFFGIAMIEAIHAGAMPLLPHRLAYPEIIPSEWHESVLYTDLDAASARLAHWLRHGIPPHAPLQQAMARFAWPRMAAQYDECFDALCTAERP